MDATIDKEQIRKALKTLIVQEPAPQIYIPKPQRASFKGLKSGSDYDNT